MLIRKPSGTANISAPNVCPYMKKDGGIEADIIISPL
jgi:hypothetical protein